VLTKLSTSDVKSGTFYGFGFVCAQELPVSKYVFNEGTIILATSNEAKDRIILSTLQEII
jgi:nucleoside 2-deoxyribosyltransferase